MLKLSVINNKKKSLQNFDTTKIQKDFANNIHKLILDKNLKTVEICEEIKTKQLSNFEIITDLTHFEEEYLNLLCDRFIFSISNCDLKYNFQLEREQEIISFFKNQGETFKFFSFQAENILRDITSSQELSERFTNSYKLPFAFSLTLIASSKWPKRLILAKENDHHSEQINLWRGISFDHFQTLKKVEFPTSLTRFYESFIPFYSENQPNKRLIFLNHLVDLFFLILISHFNFF